MKAILPAYAPRRTHVRFRHPQAASSRKLLERRPIARRLSGVPSHESATRPVSSVPSMLPMMFEVCNQPTRLPSVSGSRCTIFWSSGKLIPIKMVGTPISTTGSTR
jgi:hypothetical protein